MHKTCIVVTHDERLMKFCDKVYHMHDGVLRETNAERERDRNNFGLKIISFRPGKAN